MRLNNAHDTACAKTRARIALDFVLYDFRHTFATKMAQAGVDLPTLAAILGHNSIRWSISTSIRPPTDSPHFRRLTTIEDEKDTVGDNGHNLQEIVNLLIV